MNLLIGLSTSPVRDAYVLTSSPGVEVVFWAFAAVIVSMILMAIGGDARMPKLVIAGGVVAATSLSVVVTSIAIVLISGTSAESKNIAIDEAYVSEVSQWLALDFDIDVSADSAESLLDGKPLTVTVAGTDRQMMLVPRDNGELTVVVDGATVLAPNE